ncbi:uncharacterized protein LOC104893735 [Beta vulgaris subsp. vulgaris]|uniref:uncharacterized protein LOC104893735 n=1 Tax=Beta vulgaris subsp. vulgaris TaxID=3555 RepID=UPI00053FC24B|nr:uncharacterized protein LOC104893735 [Beta vulgaris subsp. vulgaris]
MSIRQQREEDLADYIKRFNEDTLKVSDLQDSVAFTALMSGIYPSSRFKLKLAETEASSFSEAMNLAQKFIQASDICKTHEERISGKRKHEYTPRADNPGDVPRKEKDKKPRLESNRNNPQYNLNQREIYLDIKGKYPMPKPNPIRMSFNKRDKRLWCEFHHDCGHTTRDCRELKRVLDKLADEGKWNRFLIDPKEKKVEPRQDKRTLSDETAGYVNVIVGGFSSGGLTSRSRKKHLYALKHGSDATSSAVCPTTTFKDSHRLIQTPHDDPLVVEMKIANLRVGQVLIDSGSSVDIITMDCLRKLKYEEKDLSPIDQPLVGFGGQFVQPLGSIKLPTQMGEKGAGRNVIIDYLVVDTSLPYNVIIGRPTLNKVNAAISTYQLLLQFKGHDGMVARLFGNQKSARECYVNSLKSSDGGISRKRKCPEPEEPLPVMGLYMADNPKQYERPRLADRDEEVCIDSEQGRTVRIGKQVPKGIRTRILEVIKEFQDVFAYTVDEMPGIDPKLMVHRLIIREGYKSIKQKLRHQGAERSAAASEEVQKLLATGFIRECQYTEWLANVVLVESKPEPGGCASTSQT